MMEFIDRSLRDFVWDDHYIYLVMEYCSGGDLSRFIKKKKVLPEFVAKYCLQQIASALKFLRENNVSHLDLKPQNILLSSKNSPTLKLADFGFAQHLDDRVGKKGMRGSPLYMAPEILLQNRYDARCGEAIGEGNRDLERKFVRVGWGTIFFCKKDK